jgi:hypothetical protein
VGPVGLRATWRVTESVEWLARASRDGDQHILTANGRWLAGGVGRVFRRYVILVSCGCFLGAQRDNLSGQRTDRHRAELALSSSAHNNPPWRLLTTLVCTTPCINGLDSDCPNGEKCWANIQCGSGNPPPTTTSPSTSPSKFPTRFPSVSPIETVAMTSLPTLSLSLSLSPISPPSQNPSSVPSSKPTTSPSAAPSSSPTAPPIAVSTPSPGGDTGPAIRCGIDWIDTERCHQICPNGVDLDCPNGKKCCANIQCGSGNPSPTMASQTTSSPTPVTIVVV